MNYNNYYTYQLLRKDPEVVRFSDVRFRAASWAQECIAILSGRCEPTFPKSTFCVSLKAP